jgi:hypothetical protein
MKEFRPRGTEQYPLEHPVHEACTERMSIEPDKFDEGVKKSHEKGFERTSKAKYATDVTSESYRVP